MKRRTVLQATGAIAATVAAGVSLHRAEDFRSLIDGRYGTRVDGIVLSRFWVMEGDRFILKRFEDLRAGMLAIRTRNTGKSEGIESTQKFFWVMGTDGRVIHTELLLVQTADPTGIIPSHKGDFVQISVLMLDRSARRESGQIVTRAYPELFNGILNMAREDNIRILSMIDDSEFFLAV